MCIATCFAFAFLQRAGKEPSRASWPDSAPPQASDWWTPVLDSSSGRQYVQVSDDRAVSKSSRKRHDGRLTVDDIHCKGTLSIEEKHTKPSPPTEGSALADRCSGSMDKGVGSPLTPPIDNSLHHPVYSIYRFRRILARYMVPVGV